jgi:hypothetical protein
MGGGRAYDRRVAGKYVRKIAAEIEQLGLLEESISEAKSDYTIYHQSFTAAADEARRLAVRLGFEIDEDSWFNNVATGGRYSRGRPSKGKTTRFTVDLTKNAKPQRKTLNFQVYGMESGSYELNAYVS